ncbi:hypothetical protein LTR86_002121 [Recurvomyces mirabilis]|nr:hypothetical protein LTR86_002121 [Recurvomyces mirabilis]
MSTRLCAEYPSLSLWDPPVPITVPFSLTNDLHPLCQPEMFPEARFEVLVPALRLLSRLLNTDSVIKSLRFILTGDTVRDRVNQVLSMSTEQELCECACKDRVTTGSLEGLPHYLKFKREAMPEATSGKATFVHYDHKAELEDCWLNGLHCVIKYNELDYQRLCKTYDAHNGRLQDLDYLELQDYFEFADVLMHELGHVIWGLRPERHDDEPVLDSSPFGEIGHELSNMIWGGICQSTWDEHVLYCTEWPSATIYGDYKHDGLTCTLGGEAPDLERTWRVPTGFITALFQDKYWETVVAEKGAEALRVPRICGATRTVDPCTCDEVDDTEAVEDGELPPTSPDEHPSDDPCACSGYARPSSPYPMPKRKTNPDCKFDGSQLGAYDPSAMLREHEHIDPKALVPEGCLMLWEGTLISCTVKDKVEQALKCLRETPRENDLWEALY